MLCELVLHLGIALQTHNAHMLKIAFHAVATLSVVGGKSLCPLDLSSWSVGRCSPQLAASAVVSPAAPA